MGGGTRTISKLIMAFYVWALLLRLLGSFLVDPTFGVDETLFHGRGP